MCLKCSVSVLLFMFMMSSRSGSKASGAKLPQPAEESERQTDYYDAALGSNSEAQEYEELEYICEDEDELYHNATQKCYRPLDERGQSPCGPQEFFEVDKKEGSGQYGVCLQRMCNEEYQLYHTETKKCYFEGSGGPCGEHQKLYRVSDEYGACECERNDKPDCLTFLHRPILNWSGSRRCYLAYSQGPCESGDWIVMNNSTLKSECRPNPCHGMRLQERSRGIEMYPRSRPEIFWFLKGDTCYQTFTQAYCKQNEYVRFLGTIPTPICLGIKDTLNCEYLDDLRLSSDHEGAYCAQGTKREGDACVPYVGDHEYNEHHKHYFLQNQTFLYIEFKKPL